MEIGYKIRELRLEHKLSQQELANHLHISRQSISRWELGTSTPDLNTLQKLADLFEVSIETFLETSTHTQTNFGSSETNSKRTHVEILLPLALIILALLFAVNSFTSNEVPQFHQAIDVLEKETEELTNQVYHTMENKTLSLPYSITTFKQLEEIENNIVAVHDESSNLKTSKDADTSSLQTLLKRQETLLTIIDKQQSIIVVYQPLSVYFEKDILNERGEFQYSAVVDTEISSDDLLRIERNIDDISNETLRRSFSKALSHLEEQMEVREYLALAIQNYSQSGGIEEYERLKEDILMINNRELQNEMLQLIE